eukprot:Phypoly_transcript_05427.p1 GENE.Phypoly_transcript_05427~~Phypoly_transcript_05427.p1  ORF type:complete len:470 (+),score=45.01 Phypoly_transcript_05427:477-1886(+)
MGAGPVDDGVYPKWYIPRRYNVVALSFIAITLAYMMRSNLSIAILVMSEDFDWPLSFKGMFLSAFFWGYITTQLIGGMAARRFGPKAMLIFVIVVPSFFTMFIPFVAERSEAMFVICRVLTGIAAGATFPTMFLMLSGWIPNAEKATTLALVFSGTNIGTIIIDTLGPKIMSSMGWQFVFYLSGGAGFVWVIFWYLTIADAPAEMKNIHPCEIKYITGLGEYATLLPNESNKSINSIDDYEPDGAEVKRSVENPGVPAGLLGNKEALTILMHSKSFWNIVWCGFCTNWGSYIFLTWLPTYVHTELGFSVQWSGIIAITPNISCAIMAFVSGKICDIMLMKGYNRLRVRKGFFNLGCFMYSATLVVLAYRTTLDIPNVYAATILALGTGGAGLFLPGYSNNIYDVAPYHPSLVVGISNTAGTIPGIVGVFLTGVLLQAGLGWGTIWLMTASFYVLAMVSSILFAGVERLV